MMLYCICILVRPLNDNGRMHVGTLVDDHSLTQSYSGR